MISDARLSCTASHIELYVQLQQPLYAEARMYVQGNTVLKNEIFKIRIHRSIQLERMRHSVQTLESQWHNEPCNASTARRVWYGTGECTRHAGHCNYAFKQEFKWNTRNFNNNNKKCLFFREFQIGRKKTHQIICGTCRVFSFICHIQLKPDMTYPSDPNMTSL